MKFGVFGAGSVGCYVGGMLAANGQSVDMVGRPAMSARLASAVSLSRFDGLEREVAATEFGFSTHAGILDESDVIFVCVKSGDTVEAGRVLSDVVKPGAVLVSLQNGVSNAQVLRETCPGATVLAAMVPFNVTRTGDNRFHCGTQGRIVIEDGGAAAGDIARRLTAAGVAAQTNREIEAVLWAKLLMNLNNAINVLSGLPLKRQLSDRKYRRALALSVAEALKVLGKARITPAGIAKVSPKRIPFLLRLPNWLFSIAAASMLRIDEKARSSMADDLESGRKPEIDFINGEIVRLGSKVGVPTPFNSRIVEAVHDAFKTGQSPRLSGEALLRLLAR